jgi:uncharacterized DUF497 family protein
MIDSSLDLFEFDPRKNRVNIAKHRVDFTMAARIWDDYVFEREDDRRDYGEKRFIALGTVAGRAMVVVYTWRGSKRRLISARKANRDEQKAYSAARAGLETGEET